MANSMKYDDDRMLFIDGQWCAGSEGKGEEVVNPANEEVVGLLPHASAADLDRALVAAQQAFELWRRRSPAERGAVLREAARVIASRKSDLAEILTLEQGKPLAEAKGEIDRVVETFQWCGEEATRTYGRVWPQRAPDMRQMTVKEPVGPVVGLAPWNFPAVLTARKIAPALAAGCSIIVKPAEETPGVCVRMVRALHDAGVPDGVVNLVFGVPHEVSEHLVSSPIVHKVSLTGSTAAGRAVSHLAAERLTPATMELGGHAPVIVFDDVDAGKVAATVAAFKFRNAGQVCLAPSRIYVQDAVYAEFLETFVSAAKALRVGDGFDPDTQMGPLANRRRIEAMQELVADAAAKGGSIATGGNRIGNRGYFFEPTVITDVPDHAAVMATEPFGPVAPIVRFGDFDEVIARANASRYGLAAYAFTRSVERATRVSDELEAGWIGVNNFTPFLADAPGGGYKESGFGLEGGSEGLDAYMHTKFVSQVAI
jgi:succinate-semialdehyde dehydrogenase/glutarate-semialdehyde dehydrogenase